MKLSKSLVFSEEEYRVRLNNVREKMALTGIEVLLVFSPENIFYLTGHQTFGFQNYQCCIVSLEQDPILVLRYLESFNGHAFSWVKDVEIWDDHEDPADVTVKVIMEKNLMHKTIGSDDKSLFFPPVIRDRLKEKLGEHLISTFGIVESSRVVKSEAELELMNKASIYTDIGVESAVNAVCTGATENDVAAVAYESMTKAGSEYYPLQPIVTSGWRAGIPHTNFQRRTLEPGDPVLIELSGTHHRYVSPIMRTAIVGKVTDKVHDMYKVCEEALSSVIAEIKPGVTSHSIDHVARNIITKAGYMENWRKRTGYSVGCSFPPDWGEGHIASLRYQDETILTPGMVFHIPIALRDYGVAGVGISETVVITEAGCEKLGSYKRELSAK
ncbi:Xaa-Pro peptidase family protein [Robertmurraya massiliosenegalensis]|uniref:M24 family metallopeptidase n=1 Tax=Robertmurraya TaxID=2837507 RepID=UPI0039A5C482